MMGPREQLISCLNERGSMVMVIEATREADPSAGDQAPPAVIYYTSNGYLVELLSDGTFQVALTREKLTRIE
ncbi:Hypothetical protein RG1141_PA12170 (plasmid) [Neorhizobium galegae bv. officinalis bv. officinalis str. HAMBI 1141]|uniref:Uncharacterized protein n=1 Tax=Neorhizobium galegae bv. officinalis bv. officinalis str. HAMBI 1141 TaxID=1028801 RepID=A0A068TIW0_NEOGA|nr:Hypothetical protein RG1141_PA12170 [Neorhizobium galegae bv. officinalis bv. officinalis str. HAMBI 1141]